MTEYANERDTEENPENGHSQGGEPTVEVAELAYLLRWIKRLGVNVVRAV